MKQVVDTVHKYATEDTVEDECTEELFIGTGGRKTILDQVFCLNFVLNRILCHLVHITSNAK